MAEEQKVQSPEEEKKRRIIRCISVVVIGTVAVLLFFYLAQGISELYVGDAVPEDAAMEQETR